jgi:hypothetical protein
MGIMGDLRLSNYCAILNLKMWLGDKRLKM